MKNLSISDLGQVVELTMRAGELNHASQYLEEIQTRIIRALAARAALELLAELPTVETSEPTLRHEKVTTATRAGVNPLIAAAVEALEEAVPTNVPKKHPAPEPPKGPPRDDAGKITRISVIAGDPGYDAEVHENTNMSIWCDGKHIETAHTADITLGLVRYYHKNEQGRIKTLELHGKVEIRGLQ